MRKLSCKEVCGVTVQDVLDEFNERADEFGIMDENDILSVSTHAVPPGTKIATSGGTTDVKVIVVIVYWADK